MQLADRLYLRFAFYFFVLYFIALAVAHREEIFKFFERPIGVFKKYQVYLLAIAGTLPALWSEKVFWTFTIDDVFISLRYAKNAARGFGLVFNPGERVEAFTNLLWTLIAILPHKFGVDAS